MARSNHTTIVC